MPTDKAEGYTISGHQRFKNRYTYINFIDIKKKWNSVMSVVKCSILSKLNSTSN